MHTRVLQWNIWYAYFKSSNLSHGTCYQYDSTAILSRRKTRYLDVQSTLWVGWVYWYNFLIVDRAANEFKLNHSLWELSRISTIKCFWTLVKCMSACLNVHVSACPCPHVRVRIFAFVLFLSFGFQIRISNVVSQSVVLMSIDILNTRRNFRKQVCILVWQEAGSIYRFTWTHIY
jgi:hypothetical protein